MSSHNLGTVGLPEGCSQAPQEDWRQPVCAARREHYRPTSGRPERTSLPGGQDQRDEDRPQHLPHLHGQPSPPAMPSNISTEETWPEGEAGHEYEEEDEEEDPGY